MSAETIGTEPTKTETTSTDAPTPEVEGPPVDEFWGADAGATTAE